MKKILFSLCLLAVLGTGCTMNTEYGACKGFANASEKSPALKYEYSTKNIVLAVIFSGTLLWPGLTGAFWLECPTGKAQGK